MATDRMRCLLGSLCAAVLVHSSCTPALAQSPAAPASVPSGPGSLTGIWNSPGYKGSARTPPRERVFKTIDGKWPPLLPAAAELLEKRIKLSENGEPFTNTLMQCLPGGVPEMVFGSPYPVQIIEMPGQVTMLYEMYNNFRVIYLNASHPADPDPTFMGHSVGHWEGNTLVVDTIGLTDRTTIDEVGMPHSEVLHVIERYRRTDSGTLEIIVTLDDPKTFSKPWDMKVVYKAAPAGGKLMEFICENNRTGQPDFAGFSPPTTGK
jgi:hypothetical protein